MQSPKQRRGMMLAMSMTCITCTRSHGTGAFAATCLTTKPAVPARGGGGSVHGHPHGHRHGAGA